jgi:hypothetical protein
MVIKKIKNKINQLIGAICGIKKYQNIDNFSLTY